MPLAIQVKDKGVIFRSKLEWRYSEFFDSLGIPWRYEPQTFDLSAELKGLIRSHQLYLPDFYLPSFDVYLEVKPRIKTGIPRIRLEALARHTSKLVLMSENFYDKPPVFWWHNPARPTIAKLPRKEYAQFFICLACQSVGLYPLPNCRTLEHTSSTSIACGRAHFTHHRILAAMNRTREKLDDSKIWRGRNPRRARS